MYISKEWKPHKSHKMSRKKHGIVTIIATPRFGSYRTCKLCGGEWVETVSGRAADDKLSKKCYG